MTFGARTCRNSSEPAVPRKVAPPTLDFDIYLTGYDVQTINLRDIFVAGNLPRTASVGQDPDDDISPQGPVSQDINFASCGTLPHSDLPTRRATIFPRLRLLRTRWMQPELSAHAMPPTQLTTVRLLRVQPKAK